MAILVHRTSYKCSGTSRSVLLPTSWVEFYGERADKLVITGSKMLIVAPEDMAAEAKRFVEEMEKKEN